MKKTGVPENVDAYIEGYPPKVQKILQKIRKTIQKAAPGAEESISYQMPGYKLNGVLIYFAGYEKHIGVYPAPRGAKEFKKELEQYEGGKGTVAFSVGPTGSLRSDHENGEVPNGRESSRKKKKPTGAKKTAGAKKSGAAKKR